jgi:hypothetical protein
MTPQNSSSTDDSNNPSKRLPPVGKDVLVRHNGRERLAYRDCDGNWRDFHAGSVLQGEVQIVEVE